MCSVSADIRRTATCCAPIDVAFAYVADYRTIPRWMLGIERFEPVGEQTRGEGAEFDVTARFGIRLHTRIRATEWVEQQLIGMESVRGVHVRSRFHFAEAGERTQITAEVSYRLPRGPAGRMMNRAVGPFVTRAVDHANHALLAGIERQAARA
jgi:uncharacterized membrane protein